MGRFTVVRDRIVAIAQRYIGGDKRIPQYKFSTILETLENPTMQDGMIAMGNQFIHPYDMFAELEHAARKAEQLIVSNPACEPTSSGIPRVRPARPQPKPKARRVGSRKAA